MSATSRSPMNLSMPMTNVGPGAALRLAPVVGWTLLTAALLIPMFVSSRYVVYVGTLLAIYCSLAISLNLIVGYTGQFAMSHAAFYGLGAYVSALLIGTGYVGFWTSLPVTVTFVAIIACFIGYPTLRYTGGLHFALVTFAFGELMRLIASNWDSVTNGTQGKQLRYTPEAILGFDFARSDRFYYLAAGLLLLTLAIVAAIRYSAFGRSLLAIREDEVLAASLGINVTARKTIVFIIASALAALAGAVYAPLLGYISPELLSSHESVTLIGVLIIGGLGTLSGPIIGALMYFALPEALRFTQSYRLAIMGLIIVLVVLFMPKGIVGALNVYLRNHARGRAVSGGTAVTANSDA